MSRRIRVNFERDRYLTARCLVAILACLLTCHGFTQTKTESPAWQDTAAQVLSIKSYADALDSYAIPLYDIRLLSTARIFPKLALPNQALIIMSARIQEAERQARIDVPELSLPPLDASVLVPSIIQDRYRMQEQNAQEFAEAFSKRCLEQTKAFLLLDLSELGRIRLMQCLAQLVGPTPQILKAIGLDDQHIADYRRELEVATKRILEQKLSDESVLINLTAEVKKLNEKHLTKEVMARWHQIVGTEISFEKK